VPICAIIYNDANLMPVGDAISKLPSINTNSNYSPIDSPKLFSGRLLVSRDDSQDLRKNLGKDSDSEEESRDLTQNDSNSHFSGNGSCGWIRTNGTPTEDQRVKDDGTHIGTHEMWNELNEIAEKWPNLPKEIRDAILAIVRSTKET